MRRCERVLHVIPAVAARYGGPSVAVLRLCHAQREAGLGAVIATTTADGPARLRVDLGRETTYEGVPTVFFAAYLGESLKASPGLGRWLNARVGEFDVVHVHGVFSYATVAAARAAARRGVPYLIRPLGQLDPWSLAQGRTRKRLFLALGGRSALESASRIHWTTEEERRLAPGAAARHPGFVVPLGVDETLFDRGSEEREERKPVVLFLSRLHEKKNVEGLIEAFLEVTGGGDHREWSLRIAGEGEAAYVERLREFVRRGDGEGRVSLVGWLQGEARRNALRSASLFVLPSRQENFGIAVAESMACGTPVLVSEAVNLASAIREAGAGWVASPEPGSLARELREALSSAEERERRGTAAKRMAESRFRWRFVSRALGEKYDEVVGSRGAPG